jgi:23S rRNA pseudouridine1911/1915/1917 synthase
MIAVHRREKTIIFKQSSEDSDVRLDKYLSEHKEVDLSRARIQGLIRAGAVKVNGEKRKASYQLRPGDTITVLFLPLSAPLLASEEVEFGLLHEDNSIVVVNKPPGLVVHPGAGHHGATLVQGLLHRFDHLASDGTGLRPGIVHRLDKDTSGVMVISKDDRAHHFLADQFKKRQVTKSYLALVHGRPEGEHGFMDLPIGRHPVKRKEMSVSLVKGRRAVTEWEVVSAFPLDVSLLRVVIRTGRTHQIRVHLAYVGYPVLGDRTYGYGVRWRRQQDAAMRRVLGLTKRQMLHAETLGFIHPESKRYVEFTAPLHPDMEEVIEWLRTVKPGRGQKSSKIP